MAACLLLLKRRFPAILPAPKPLCWIAPLNDDEADAITAPRKSSWGDATFDVASVSGATVVLSGTISTGPNTNDVAAIVGPELLELL